MALSSKGLGNSLGLENVSECVMSAAAVAITDNSLLLNKIASLQRSYKEERRMNKALKRRANELMANYNDMMNNYNELVHNYNELYLKLKELTDMCKNIM